MGTDHGGRDGGASNANRDADEHRSIWLETTEGTSFPRLDGDVDVETAVVGGGIVGVTAAADLAAAGRSVAVIESDRIVEGVTGHTTAKLTSQHGLIYRHLIENFGREKAGHYAAANEAAIDRVESTAAERGIDCDFGRLPAYTYATTDPGRRRVRREVDAARELGLPATYEESVPLSVDVTAAIRFDDQGHFHPRKYLLGLAEDLPDDCHVFENTKAVGLDRGTTCRVETETGTVTAENVIVATHFPFYDRGLYFARMRPKRSYVLAVRVAESPPEAMLYRTGETYFSVRPYPAGEESTVLVGGENHRTGHGGSVRDRYRRLERAARDRFDVESVEYRWSTQDFVSVDRVPFVGKLAPQTDRVYVATGFGGWGMSNGVAAGGLVADLAAGESNEWADVYRPSRINPRTSAGELYSHNAHAARHFVDDWLHRGGRRGVDDVEPGEADILARGTDTVGVYRDHGGDVHAVSVVCTHLNCVLSWNDGEKSWDCPCHGSRFGYDGEVLDGPAVRDLPTRDVE